GGRRRLHAERRGRRAALGDARRGACAALVRPRPRAARMTVVLLRHASAGERDEWTGADRARPLDARGRERAEALVPELRRLGVRRVVSSPYVRCAQTVEPLGLPVEYDDRLAEN